MDSAPKKEQTSEHINLKVIGSDKNEIAFKIKRTTPLQKLMDAYIEKMGFERNSVRFLFDGQRLVGSNTPQDLDMENEDIITAASEQIGGSY